MPPASSPALSWDVPRVADTVCDCWALKVSGRAPYFNFLARSFAVLCVKLPVIDVGWPLMAVVFTGAEITRPSRVKPTKSAQGVEVDEHDVAGGKFVESLEPMLWAPVYLAHALLPLDLSVSWTDQSALVVLVWAEALSTSVPGTTTGPSR